MMRPRVVPVYRDTVHSVQVSPGRANPKSNFAVVPPCNARTGASAPWPDSVFTST